MQFPVHPYLKILNDQIKTTLCPKEDGMARSVAQYAEKMLSTLVVDLELLPSFEAEALKCYQELHPELTAALQAIDGAQALLPELHAALHSQPSYAAAHAVLHRAAPLLATHASPAARALVQRIARIELDKQNARHAAVIAASAPPPPTADASEPLSPAQISGLRDYLRLQFPAESGVDVGAIKAIAGGFSKQTIFVDLLHTVKLPPQVVLRVDKSASPVQSTVVDEFALIKTMFEAGVPVPQPFAVTGDHAVIGAPFILLSRVAGRNIGAALDVDQPNRTFGLNLARHVARIHQVPPANVAHPLHGAGMSTQARMSQDLAEFESKWRATGFQSIAVELAFAWMREHLDLAESQPVIIHRDIGCHNMLVDNDELSALLDWETACIGSFAQDLGYAFHTVEALLPWSDFVAEYVRHGGAQPRQIEVDYYRLWRALWLVVINAMARSYVEAELTKDVGLAWASQYAFQRVDQTLHELVDLVLTRY